MEDYTYTEQKKAHLVLCVFDRKGNYPGEKMCAGPLCMGWVHETDETGMPTGRGRCGMVNAGSEHTVRHAIPSLVGSKQVEE